MYCLMRYADGGGLTAEGRARREAVRRQAARLFAVDVPAVEIARRLRVSVNSVYRWRRVWRSGGVDALASKGSSGSLCRLDAGQQARLAAVLREGPAAYGFDDQRWTLARVAEVIAGLFGVSYTLRGVSYVLHRMGLSPQVPKHRAIERDEAAIEAWRGEVWPRVKGSRPSVAR
jgi:putative transposase